MLEVQINEDLKNALKEGNKPAVSALRMLISAVKNKKIEEKAQEQELEDSKVMGVIQKLAKQYKESIEQFKEAGRQELVEKESGELKAIEKYLPSALSEEELIKIIEETIAGMGASSPADMGKVMKEVMNKTAGRADGKIVSQKVREKLS